MKTARKSERKPEAEKIAVDGVELTVAQTGNFARVSKVIGRDRRRKIDITFGAEFPLDDPAAITLLKALKRVAATRTTRCTCDYRYGFSDHAEHCQSIHVASYDGGYADDD